MSRGSLCVRGRRKPLPKMDHDPASAAPAWPGSPCPCACPCSRMPNTCTPSGGVIIARAGHRARNAVRGHRRARPTRTEVPPGSTISINPLVRRVATAGTYAGDLVATADVSVTVGDGTSRSPPTTSTRAKLAGGCANGRSMRCVNCWRHAYSCPDVIPCLWMTSLGRTPAPRLSATISCFCSSDHRRRLSPRVICSTRGRRTLLRSVL